MHQHLQEASCNRQRSNISTFIPDHHPAPHPPTPDSGHGCSGVSDVRDNSSNISYFSTRTKSTDKTVLSTKLLRSVKPFLFDAAHYLCPYAFSLKPIPTIVCGCVFNTAYGCYLSCCCCFLALSDRAAGHICLEKKMLDRTEANLSLNSVYCSAVIIRELKNSQLASLTNAGWIKTVTEFQQLECVLIF